MDIYFILFFVGLILTGVVIAAPIAYHLGRRNQRREFEPVWNHVDDLHRANGHKFYMILSPKIQENGRLSR